MLLCMKVSLKADKSNWKQDGGRSIPLTVYVTEDVLYVETLPGESCVIHISMQDETGMTYIYDVTASPDQPGTVSLSELPAGTYDVCLTADNGMTTHGVLTVL